MLLVCHYIGADFHLENFLNIICQSFSPSLDFQYPQSFSRSCLKNNLVRITVPPGEGRGGGVEGWEQGSRLGVGTFSKSGVSTFCLFPFLLVISLLCVSVSAPEK